MRPVILCLLSAAALPGWAADKPAFLWQKPAEMTVADWVWGPGGEAHAPQPPFEFLEEDLKGTNPKIKVRDAKGDRWVVKFGGEDHSDVFASRLLFAMGYASQPTCFIRSGEISGTHGLKRAKPYLGKQGEFSYARFKIHQSKKTARVDGMDWSWNQNPFVGTHELNGLKILMMLMSNWDAKDARDGKGSNTAVYATAGPGGESLLYAFDDWGATLGKWGGFFSRDKWNADGYRGQTRDFARSGDGETIRWGYRGKHAEDITAGVGIDDVRWLLTYLSAVSDQELRAGSRASGATPAETDAYADAIRSRISQLQHLCDGVRAAR
jgi:hypothetical protein